MTPAAEPAVRSPWRIQDRGHPNPTPRPEGEFEQLTRVWEPPRGIRILAAVNNTYIGLWYVATALLFFVLAGILALIMRTQLAVPRNNLVGADLYNQLFTMHGTVMMFLFAVPVVEAMGVYLLPNMQAARDLPFPRLSAYAFWAYAVGGLAFFATIFFGLAPRGGWFMYPPLTSYTYSPDISPDFWLLGIGFIEISAIAGAIEIIVGVFKTRAPGQSLDKLPVYSWTMLAFAAMVILAFPAVILATLLLELERAFQWPFFLAEQGGHPLLWQHLFWFFGHPEVYLIFLPAAGFVSMIVPTMAQTPLVGYRLVVLAIIATIFLSLGLWVHHMFTTGIPQLSLSFFAASSMAVAIPSGIQVFAWIATMASGKLRLNTPSLFILGFLFTFTLGGLTGVMVATVPFDWQAHDTYFVVAHLHYVLIGGLVFPLFAAFYYWVPTASRKPLSQRLGTWVFWMLFLGVNITFFPMHIVGLAGMPRRNYTYLAELDWDRFNLISTLGSYLIAAAVLLFLVDLALNFRFSFERNAGNIWNAGTLEWLPTGTYQTRSIPYVASREPLWDAPDLAREVAEGAWFLPGAATGGRETIVTSPVDARPQYLLRIPGEPSWSPFLAALFTAAFFFALTVRLVVPASLCGIAALAMVIRWLWDTDKGPTHPPVDIGGGINLPVYVTGPLNHSWWAMIVLILCAGTLFGCMLFSYFFLWTVNPGAWPPAGVSQRPLGWPAAVGILFAASSLLIHLASRFLRDVPARNPWPMRLALLVAIPLMAAGLAADIAGHWQSGLRAHQHSYGAAIYAMVGLQGLYVAAVVVMGLYTLARSLCGMLDSVRRSTFDNTMLLWHYTTVQGVIAAAIVALFPSLTGAAS